jgi:hypothetical protein
MTMFNHGDEVKDEVREVVPARLDPACPNGKMLPMLAIDRQAERTLVGMFWGAGGWKPEREAPDAERYVHAREAGYLFEPLMIDHDELIHRTIELGRELTLRDASDSFLASLSTRHLFLRPSLPALVFARVLSGHDFVTAGARPDGTYDGGSRGCCAVCDERAEILQVDLNILNFERLKWGGVRHRHLAFVWFCLDRLQAEGPAEPTRADADLLRSMLDALRVLPPDVSLTQAEAALRFLKSNTAERLNILEILSMVGVLQDPAHPGFLHEFIPAFNRALPPRRFLDRGYPAEWWRAAHGVNDEAAEVLFPQLDA